MPQSTAGTTQIKISADKPSKNRLRAMVPSRLRQWRSRTLNKPPARRNLNIFLREWHKRAGIAAFIFMIWLGASGFLINQSSAWGYDTIRIDWSWVTGLYGLKASPPNQGFVDGDAWLAKSGDVVALNGEELPFSIPTPLGFVASDAAGLPLLYIATRESLYAVTPEGELYERMNSPIIPVRELVRLGTFGTSIVIEGRDGLHASPDGGLSWSTPDSEAITWSEQSALTEPQRDELAPFSRPTMSLEQTLLDLHSGRIFGDVGVWVVNVVGFLAIFLGISGIWMTWRISRQRSRRGS